MWKLKVDLMNVEHRIVSQRFYSLHFADIFPSDHLMWTFPPTSEYLQKLLGNCQLILISG